MHFRYILINYYLNYVESQFCDSSVPPIVGGHLTHISTSAMSRFQDVADKINFADEEVKTLKYWADIDAFQTSLKLSEGKPEYTFYDGPPFATGLPHYGLVSS